jgi:hypothetical protein
MTNINDLGLPPAWPVLYADRSVYTHQRSRGWYDHDGSYYLYEESDKWPRVYTAHREMTAADLGLPLGQWDYEWLESIYGAASEYYPDPYFWLGADK